MKNRLMHKSNFLTPLLKLNCVKIIGFLSLKYTSQKMLVYCRPVTSSDFLIYDTNKVYLDFDLKARFCTLSAN